MAEELSCRSPYPKEYIRIGASGNPEGPYRLQLSTREKMNAEFSATYSLPIFIQFLSNNWVLIWPLATLGC